MIPNLDAFPSNPEREPPMHPVALIVPLLTLAFAARGAASARACRRLHAVTLADARAEARLAAYQECKAAFVVLARRVAQAEARLAWCDDAVRQCLALLDRFPGLAHPVADDGPPIVLGKPRPADGDDDLGQILSLVD
jgi:hypothetical protein